MNIMTGGDELGQMMVPPTLSLRRFRNPRSLGAAFRIPGVKTERTAKKWRKKSQNGRDMAYYKECVQCLTDLYPPAFSIGSIVKVCPAAITPCALLPE